MLRLAAIALAAISAVQAANSCPAVRSEGEPQGQIKNVNGTQIYHTYPAGGPKASRDNTKAILYVSDIFGLPLLQNKVLADSLTQTSYPVIFPDLFSGDAYPVTTPDHPAPDLTEWIARHPPAAVDAILDKTIAYMRSELGVTKIGAVGYCFGGKYVPRHMAEGKGIDVGFIAHPSGLEDGEIKAIAGPISVAAGQLDGTFNAAARRNAEDILTGMNAVFQTVLYSQAPHGFAVRVNMSAPAEKFAKEGAFLQAVKWF
ncbi:alpha/beta-hydrolase, partial [Westerdykella ornata]